MKNDGNAAAYLSEVSARYTSWIVSLARLQFESAMEDVLDHTTGYSPIERAAALGFLTIEWSYRLNNETFLFSTLSPGQRYEKLARQDHTAAVSVWMQCGVGKYRADFIVRYQERNGPALWAAIECDGHDFHERTRKQAEHDKVRDRHFQSVGLLVLRYTGGEIWREPSTSVAGIFEILKKRSRGEI